MFQYVFSLSPTFLQTSKKKKSIKQKHQFSQMPTLVIEFTESLIRLCKNTMDFQESWWNSAGTSTVSHRNSVSPDIGWKKVDVTLIAGIQNMYR